MSAKFNVLFDVDDTLYSRRMPFENAWNDTFVPLPEEIAYPLYKDFIKYGYEVYEDYMSGRISPEEMFLYRISKPAEKIGMHLTPEMASAFQRRYDYWQGRLYVSDDMAALLDGLKERGAFLAVITNGTEQRQWRKYEVLHLERWFSRDLYLPTGEVGVSKPDPEIFRIATRRWQLDPEKTWYIGDHIDHDVRATLAFGWHAMYLCKDKDADTETLFTPAEKHPDVIAKDDRELCEKALAWFDALKSGEGSEPLI